VPNPARESTKPAEPTGTEPTGTEPTRTEVAPVPQGASSAADWSLPRGLIVLMGMAGAVVAVAGLRSLSHLIGPIFLALMLTVAVYPLQGLVVRKGGPRWLGMVAALLTVYLILIGLVASLAVSVARLATILPTYGPEFNALVGGAEETLAGFGIGQEEVNAALDQIDYGNLVGALESVLAGLLGVFSNVFLILAVLLFMGLDGAGFPERLKAAGKLRPDIVSALSSFSRGTRRYLVVSTVFGLIVAVFDGIALWWLGIPLPLLWALLSFITNYIPNVGFIIGVIPPALLGLLQGGWQLALSVVVVYSVINFVIQSIIQPKFVGDSVGLSTTLTFVSLLFWAWVIGALGALLAIPLTLLTKALLIDIDPSTRWVNLLLGSGPVAARADAVPLAGPEGSEPTPELLPDPQGQPGSRPPGGS
jgi:predicted PurR-regulated permease PerM